MVPTPDQEFKPEIGLTANPMLIDANGAPGASGSGARAFQGRSYSKLAPWVRMLTWIILLRARSPFAEAG